MARSISSILFDLQVEIAQDLGLHQAAQQVGIQAAREALGVLHRGGAHQLRAAHDVVMHDLHGDGAQLGFLAAVNHIREVLALPEDRAALRVLAAGVIGELVALLVFGIHFLEERVLADGVVFQVGRDGQDIQLVDLVELLRLGERRTGHPASFAYMRK